MIEVRVRYIDDVVGSGHKVGEFPPSEIKPLIGLFRENMVYGESHSEIIFEECKLVDTEIVANEEESFFEIIVK